MRIEGKILTTIVGVAFIISIIFVMIIPYYNIIKIKSIDDFCKDNDYDSVEFVNGNMRCYKNVYYHNETNIGYEKQYSGIVDYDTIR